MRSLNNNGADEIENVSEEIAEKAAENVSEASNEVSENAETVSESVQKEAEKAGASEENAEKASEKASKNNDGPGDAGGKKRRPVKKIIIIAIIAALVLLAGYRIATSHTSTPEVGETAINVNTVVTEESTLDSYITISGKITPKSEVYVVPKAQGKVTAVYAELGDWVNKGDLLFTIDKTDVELALRQAEAALSSAQASYSMTTGGSSEQTVSQLEMALTSAESNLNTAQSALERVEALYEVGGASQQEYEQAKTGYDLAKQQYEFAKSNYDLTVNKILGETEKTARAGLQQAQAAYDVARNAYENTNVRAEVSGYVGSSSVVVGGMVSAAQPPMTIVDVSEVYASVGLPETVINSITSDQRVNITVSSIPDRVFEGTIVGISPSAGLATKTYETKIVINNASGELKGGMFASVRFITETVENAITLPISAVKDDDGEKYVYVIDSSDRAHRKVVQTGASNDESIEITSGLSVGETVVIKGQDFLDEGTLVQIISESAAKAS